MSIDPNEVITQLGDAPPAQDGNAAIVHQLQRIDNAVRLIAVVVVVPVVAKIVAAAAATVVGAVYVAKHGNKALPALRHDASKIKSEISSAMHHEVG